MVTLLQRYEEIIALIDEDYDIFHGGSVVDYILAAAELLGFKHPSLALDLETDIAELMDMFGKEI